MAYWPQIYAFTYFQETYPHTAPIWFSESEDVSATAAIEKLCETAPDNFNVSPLAIHLRRLLKWQSKVWLGPSTQLCASQPL